MRENSGKLSHQNFHWYRHTCELPLWPSNTGDIGVHLAPRDDVQSCFVRMVEGRFQRAFKNYINGSNFSTTQWFCFKLCAVVANDRPLTWNQVALGYFCVAWMLHPLSQNKWYTLYWFSSKSPYIFFSKLLHKLQPACGTFSQPQKNFF